MKIMFLTGYAISHMYPLESLIKFLKDKHEIYIMCTDENKWLVKKWEVNEIIYPDKYWKHKYKNEDDSYKIDDSIQEQYISYLKRDALSTFNIFDDVLEFLETVINRYKFDVIFKDSTDIYWEVLRKKYTNIRTIGYITNNLYSWKYIQNYDKIIHFLGIVDIEKDLDSLFLKNFKMHIDKIYDDISVQKKEYPIRSYYQYDPNEKINLIFSMPFFQPYESLNCDCENYIITPEKENFEVETSIPESLKSFVNKEKVIYISTGSFITKDLNYYLLLIKLLLKIENAKIVLSSGKQSEKIREYINKLSLQNRVAVYKYVPQKYVLSNCKLFICSGGFNSIKEAIYFKVPMIVIPITCEQRLNGLIIEELGIGYTLYKKNQRSIEYLLSDLLNKNAIINENLAFYSHNIIDVKSNSYNFNKIDQWISDE